mgnify:CR=1 FL=1
MAVVQFLCAKVGMVSGMGLAGVLRKNYSRAVLYPAVFGLVVANTINAGTDIGAIAAAVNLLFPIPVVWLIVPIALIIVVIQIWGSYKLISRIFKWLALTLFAYIGAAILAKPPWREVLHATFIPQFSFDGKFLLTWSRSWAQLISPYLFFGNRAGKWKKRSRWDARLRRNASRATYAELHDAAVDTNIGTFFCNLVFYFVILAAASTLHVAGKTDIQSATDAAQALRPLAGNASSVLFALGLIGAGFPAVPVLTGASAYAVAETFGWECQPCRQTTRGEAVSMQ